MVEDTEHDAPDALGGGPDLLRLVELPVRWRGRGPDGVAEVLLDEVSAVLRAEVAWVRLAGPRGPPTERVRCVFADDGIERVRELVRRLEGAAADATGVRTLAGATGLWPRIRLQLACAPIGERGGDGLLAVGSERPDFPTETERRLLTVAATQVGIGLECALLRERCDEAARDRILLQRISDDLNRTTRLEDVLGSALDGIQQALRTERSAILLLGDSGMRFEAARGLSEAYQRAFDGVPSPWEPAGGSRAPIVCVDVESCAELAAWRDVFRSERIGSVAWLPLVYGERVLGKLMVCFDLPHRLEEREVQLAATIASGVGQAIGRRQAEAENASLVADLQRNLHFSELFVGVLGHDLRNPLFAIKSAAYLMARRVSPQLISESARRISDSANRMSRMIEQILDFTRLRLGGEIPLACELVDLDVVVQGVADELHTVDGDRDLARSRIGDPCGEWDRDRLAQMMSNLLGNAYQHATPGTRIELVVDGRAPSAVSIEIRSHGGIEPERLHDLFEPLRARPRRADGKGSSGLGLGLYICRQIVLAHGGSIRAESEDGITRFHVDLPRRPRGCDDRGA